VHFSILLVNNRNLVVITLAPGVDGMLTILWDFQQFSVKKTGVFLKTNVLIKFLHNLALFRVKNAIFDEIIFKL
jgi:hypothetical protein